MTIKLIYHLCTHRFQFRAVCVWLCVNPLYTSVRTLMVWYIQQYIRNEMNRSRSNFRPDIMQTQEKRRRSERRGIDRQEERGRDWESERDGGGNANESCMCAVMRRLPSPPFIRFRKFCEASSRAIYFDFFRFARECVNSISNTHLIQSTTPLHYYVCFGYTCSFWLRLSMLRVWKDVQLNIFADSGTPL